MYEEKEITPIFQALSPWHTKSVLCSQGKKITEKEKKILSLHFFKLHLKFIYTHAAFKLR